MTEKEIVLLGALLHDIGKFQYRADVTRAGGDHETRGEGIIKSKFSNFKLFEGRPQELLRLVENSKRSHSAIKRADIHSAAGEREQDNSNQTRRPLISIFSRINIGKAKIPDGVYYYDPDYFDYESSSIQDRIKYPKHLSNETVENWKPDEKDIIAKHKLSYIGFLKDISLLSTISDFKSFYSSLLSIMEKWVSRVSSAGYYSVPDISLYDHSRKVATLTHSYYLISQEDKECLMIKGDISGIQNFIFKDIESTDSAAKTLRGRSLFIRILSDAVVRYILNELNLLETDVFYNSGGHFVIIAPNNRQNREKLMDIEQNTSKFLFEKYEGELQFIIAKLEVAGDELQINFDKVISQLDENLINEKQHKAFSILEDMMSEPIKVKNDKQSKNNYGKFFSDIGTILPKTNYILEVTADRLNTANYNNIIKFKSFNVYYILSRAEDLNTIIKNLESETNIKRIKIYNTIDNNYKKIADEISHTGLNIAFGHKYLGSYIPMGENNEPITFEKLSEISGNKENLTYPALGYLRMDVDSLGKIFRFGLNELHQNDKNKQLYSMSRAASLSREIDLFFSSQIRNIAKKHKVYLVYSGGDDLFAVASWKKIIDFALAVKDEFTAFVCNNANITISGGIMFANKSYPVALGAKNSGEYLEKAKEDKAPLYKNKITLFGRVLSWSEAENYLDIADNILKILGDTGTKKNDKISRGFLYSLLTMTKQCIDRNGILKPEQVARTTAKMHYYFARQGVDEETIEKKKDEFKVQFAKYFIKSNTEELEKWYKNFVVPASYVILLTRNSKNK